MLATARRHAIPQVQPAWEELPPAPAPPPRAAAAGGGRGDAAGVVAAGGAADPWAGRGLRVPEERNNHFFVRGMGEFLFAHLEGADEEPSCD